MLKMKRLVIDTTWGRMWETIRSFAIAYHNHKEGKTSIKTVSRRKTDMFNQFHKELNDT